MDKLKCAGHRDSTRRNYHAVWRQFNKFFIRLDVKPSSWKDRIVLFAGYLIDQKGCKSQTVKSYISAIKSVLKADGIEVNENRYLLTSLTNACKLVNDQVRIRLPIRKPLLKVLLRKVDNLYSSPQVYLTIMYRALISTAYYGHFRVGELTTGDHPVAAHDVHIGNNKNKLLFILRTSKTHWKNVKPQIVKIFSNKINDLDKFIERDNLTVYCPFALLHNYLQIRPPYREDDKPFFIFSDRTPVRPHNMRTTLRAVLEQTGLTPQSYDTHSLRLGRAVDLLHYKVQISVIRHLGRWKSNAVFTYLNNL